MIENNTPNLVVKFFIHTGFFLTIILGFFFEYFQFFEYLENFFCLNSTNYGRNFYMLTGFHGFHVMLGLLILLVS
jgi:cytochrome c oxidase subunit 3